MDKLVPIIYMLGVFLLILPAFMNSNNSFKIFLLTYQYGAITLVVFSLYYFYNLYLMFDKFNSNILI